MPFGGSCEFEDFDACVAANQDREDPDAYCAALEDSTKEACAAADTEEPQAAEAETEADGRVAFTGPVVFEGELTGDGREMEAGALRWETPIPLRWVPTETEAHDGAVVVGRIDELVRVDDAIVATGTIDTSFEAGATIASMIERGLAGGVSVDLDDVEVEVDEEAQVMTVLDGRIRGVTLVSLPAFANARIALDGMPAPEVDPLTAAGYVAPPTAHFLNPNFTELTPIKLTEDGRLFGHIAGWGTCHSGFQGQCITAPHSSNGYASYRTGLVITAEGDEVPVGRITMDTGHAGPRMAAAPAAAHYDHTGTVVADVACGEDKHGIWISGSLRSGVDAERLHALRSAPMSGDWRDVGGKLELVGVLAVNLPGFAVPRKPTALVASGRPMAFRAPVPNADQASRRRIISARARMLADRIRE